jgi:biofilm PGA synthesis N-glycosyltransferase PgaC
MGDDEHLVAILPFFNEEEVLPRVLEAFDRQDRRPDQLLLVDDGSSDDSAEIVRAFKRRRPWVDLKSRPARPPQLDPHLHGASIAAFMWGLSGLSAPWTVAAKLDADIVLPDRALTEMLDRFTREPSLGICGFRLSEPGPHGRLVRIPIGDGHTHGGTKFYRRQCWEKIAPIPSVIGFDAIDDIRAQLAGWTTQSIELDGGDPIHLRPMNSRDGVLRGDRRNGQGSWVIGEHPLIVVRHSVKRMASPPRVIGGLHFLFGWIRAGLTRAPRAESQLRAHVKRQQLRELWLRVRRANTRA